MVRRCLASKDKDMRFPDPSLYDLSFPSPPRLRLSRLLLKTPVIRSQTIEIAHRNIKDPPSRAEMKEIAPNTKYPFDPGIAKVALVIELTVTFEAELGAATAFDVEPLAAMAVNEALGAESVNVGPNSDGNAGSVGIEGKIVTSAMGSGIALMTEASLEMVLLSISVMSGRPGLRFDCASAI